MTSFLTHRAHVHDARLPLRRRHSALRTCITLFAPYGFRATYHHLTLSAAIPRRLEADPDALVRAVEELHEARVLWLARAERGQQRPLDLRGHAHRGAASGLEEQVGVGVLGDDHVCDQPGESAQQPPVVVIDAVQGDGHRADLVAAVQ